MKGPVILWPGGFLKSQETETDRHSECSSHQSILCLHAGLAKNTLAKQFLILSPGFRGNETTCSPGTWPPGDGESQPLGPHLGFTDLSFRETATLRVHNAAPLESRTPILWCWAGVVHATAHFLSNSCFQKCWGEVHSGGAGEGTYRKRHSFFLFVGLK